ncbi:Zinc finger, RING/FYVE/PHD-type [Artemisia annua]|uniref:Zinc finger, RING/FYVE/PHD-type n=1 Tax=Artemisia annua TaxID=35608 RepID=A0A2U1KBF6_ARTAN|nr:Zinc finger, RING/FYVE/PHD-type [Artemisia annua]
MEDHGGETTGLTLGGILSIKQTPPYRINDRTLLDLIRDDHHQSLCNEPKLTWKMLRKKFRLKLVGTGCNTAVPTLASHVTVTGNGTTLRSHLNLPVSNESSMEVTEARGGEEVARDDGEREPRMSLMALLEVDGSSYVDGDVDDDVAGEVVSVNTTGVVDENEKYNNCCVCMVRHKGAAFIPCGHTFCRLCSRELFVKRASCPLCNHFIVEILDIF